MRKKDRKFGFGVTGMLLGGLCLGFLCALEIFGPGSYTTTGSGTLNVGETVTTEVARPLLSRIAIAAFYTCFVAFLFGVASRFRGEAIVVSTGAIAFGIAPIIIYTLGLKTAILLYSGLMLPLVVALYHVLRGN